MTYNYRLSCFQIALGHCRCVVLRGGCGGTKNEFNQNLHLYLHHKSDTTSYCQRDSLTQSPWRSSSTKCLQSNFTLQKNYLSIISMSKTSEIGRKNLDLAWSPRMGIYENMAGLQHQTEGNPLLEHHWAQMGSRDKGFLRPTSIYWLWSRALDF